MTYSKELNASTSLCGANCNLSPIGFLQIVQDVICEYFESIGIDQITIKQKHNAVWVFLKNKLKVFENIFWNEKYKVDCFISFKSQAKLIVDTKFCSLDGKIKAYAKTEICLVDLATFRIRRISSEILPEDFATKNSFCDISFEKFESDGLMYVSSAKVESTHIDSCGHCNNVEYLRILFNTYSAIELNKLDIESLEIVYISQSLEGETLDIYSKIVENCHIFEFKSQDKSIFKCKIIVR